MVTLTSRTSDSDGSIPGRRSDDLSGHAHRRLIGYIGLALPVILVVLAGLLPTEELPPWRILDSISAYYYTAASAAFVGMLVALALFLFTYRGYDNEYGWADRTAAVVAGFAALGVAFFPTDAPLDALAVSWWKPVMSYLHYGSAAVLFSMFAVFSLWLFRISKSSKPTSRGKRLRNHVYLASGLIIIGSMIWALIAGVGQKSIFLPEAIALIAFAVSWLVKGRARERIAGALRSMARR